MGTYSGYLLDLKYIRQGIDKSRFLLNFEVDSAGFGQQGRWRQSPLNDRRYWKTAAGNFTVISKNHVARDVSNFSVTFKDNSRFNTPVFKLENLYMGNAGDYPYVGGKGLGYLYETPEFGPFISTTRVALPNKPNVFWTITELKQAFIEDKDIWFGGGFKYGGEAGYKRDAVHGWVVNLVDPSKWRYVQIETEGISFGLGGQAGIVVILINAQNPRDLLNKPSDPDWDFSFCLGGKFAKYLKEMDFGADALKYKALVNIAHGLYKHKGVLQGEDLFQFAGTLKALFSATGLMSSPKYCVIDTPLAGGLALGINRTKSIITLI